MKGLAQVYGVAGEASAWRLALSEGVMGSIHHEGPNRKIVGGGGEERVAWCVAPCMTVLQAGAARPQTKLRQPADYETPLAVQKTRPQAHAAPPEGWGAEQGAGCVVDVGGAMLRAEYISSPCVRRSSR